MVALGILGIFALLQQSGFTSGARSARENDQMGKLVRQVQKLSEVFNEDISRLREELKEKKNVALSGAPQDTQSNPSPSGDKGKENSANANNNNNDNNNNNNSNNNNNNDDKNNAIKQLPLQHHDHHTARHFLHIESLEHETIRRDEPGHLILTTTNKETTLSEAAEMVDAFLSRHSIYQVESEPSSAGEPLIWMLERVPEPEFSVYKALDKLQFDQASQDCSAVMHSKYWCSGWHADLWYSVRGSINEALRKKKPVNFVFPEVCKDHDAEFVKSWHYAADACPAKDLTCYFLNVSACPRPERFEEAKEQFSLERSIPPEFKLKFEQHKKLAHKPVVRLWDIHNDATGELYNFLLYSYATRMRYWLRQEVKRRVAEFNLKQPCAVMHVRQNDIALHDNWRRFYYPLKAYIEKGKDALDAMGIHTILLMTDSAEVLDETKAHREYQWRWMEKYRFRRDRPIKFENQFPSGSPKEETIALLTLYHLASECRLFIGGVSGFGTLAYRYQCLLHTKNIWDCPPVRVLDQHKAYNGTHANPDPRHNASSEHYKKHVVPAAAH